MSRHWQCHYIIHLQESPNKHLYIIELFSVKHSVYMHMVSQKQHYRLKRSHESVWTILKPYEIQWRLSNCNAMSRPCFHDKLFTAVFLVASRLHLRSWCAVTILYTVLKQATDMLEPLQQTLTAFQRCIKWRATSWAPAPTTNAPTSCHGIRGVVFRSTRSVNNHTKQLVKDCV
jgi:hypothetical protein